MARVDPSVNRYCVLCAEYTSICFQCSICDKFICDVCCNANNKNIKRAKTRRLLCELCELHYVERKRDTSLSYCAYCDSIYPYGDGCFGRCRNCTIADKRKHMNLIEARKLLPHKKAKLIIELHLVPEIAQLIFDYYYYPRRYLLGEY